MPDETTSAAPAPSTGRIVHFFDTALSSEPIAAVVTRVRSVGEDEQTVEVVDLTLFMPGVPAACVSGIPQAGAQEYGRYWDWPARA